MFMKDLVKQRTVYLTTLSSTTFINLGSLKPTNLFGRSTPKQ